MLRYAFAVAVLALCPTAAVFAGGEINIYSARHYDMDDQLYADFEAASGIRVNRIEAEADELIERLKSEGVNSPADIILTVDAGRIWRAEEAGLLQVVDSATLSGRIPAHLRHPDGLWFGLSQRARIIFFAKDRVANPPQAYADLADPQYEGRVCIRSSSNVYNQSLLGAIIAHEGADAAKAWAAGVVSNFARDPNGGDTDQLRAIVSGECDIAVANTYYFLRALTNDVDGLSGKTDMIGWVFPNQESTGTHMNIAAAGVAAHAPNRDNAVAFIEYLVTDEAQAFFASQNNEYPVVPSVQAGDVPLRLGTFVGDDLDLSLLGENQPAAQQIFNEVGWR